MKDIKYKELIAYASAFVSFILPKVEADEIILFGSSARGEADKESDIDIFFNIRKEERNTKKIIKVELDKFYKSRIYETFKLKGISNLIKFEIGNLDDWKLKRSIISDGILLYGKYKEVPKDKRGFVHFYLNPIKIIAKRNKIIRELFGRTEKKYARKGMVEIIGGKKISSSSFIVPIEKSNEISIFLNKEKAKYTLFEFWTDEF